MWSKILHKKKLNRDTLYKCMKQNKTEILRNYPKLIYKSINKKKSLNDTRKQYKYLLNMNYMFTAAGYDQNGFTTSFAGLYGNLLNLIQF